MNTTLRLQSERWPFSQSKVLTSIQRLFKNKNNPTTIIMADYNKRFIRNTITSKLVAYKNWRKFWTLEFLDKSWHSKKFIQDKNILVYSVDNITIWWIYMDEKNIFQELNDRI